MDVPKTPERQLPLVFGLNDMEEFTLTTNGAVRLRYHKSDSAREGDHVRVEGKEHVYEVRVEKVEPSEAPDTAHDDHRGQVSDADFHLSLVRTLE